MGTTRNYQLKHSSVWLPCVSDRVEMLPLTLKDANGKKIRPFDKVFICALVVTRNRTGQPDDALQREDGSVALSAVW